MTTIKKSVKRVYRTPVNYDAHHSINDVEVPYGKSLTAPDQTQSVREQLSRFQNGTLRGMSDPIFMSEDDDAPDFTKMDAIEIMNWREQALIKQQQLDDQFKKASKELADKHDKDRIDAEVERRLQEKLNNPNPNPKDAPID